MNGGEREIMIKRRMSSIREEGIKITKRGKGERTCQEEREKVMRRVRERDEEK